MKRANIKYLFIALFFISKSFYAETQKRITIIGNENIDNEIIFVNLYILYLFSSCNMTVEI